MHRATVSDPPPPLLLLDIDGVISLFGFDLRRPPIGRYAMIDGHLHYLSTTASSLVAELTELYQPVWCSGWEDRADSHLPSALGLPAGLAYLRFGDGDGGAGATTTPGRRRHWKLDAIDAFAGPDRALAWLDDAHDDSCAAWATQRHGPTLLVATDPAAGITATHVRVLREWHAATVG